MGLRERRSLACECVDSAVFLAAREAMGDLRGKLSTRGEHGLGTGPLCRETSEAAWPRRLEAMTSGVFTNSLRGMSHTGFFAGPAPLKAAVSPRISQMLGRTPSLHLSLDEFENYNLEEKSSICWALNLKAALK